MNKSSEYEHELIICKGRPIVTLSRQSASVFLLKFDESEKSNSPNRSFQGLLHFLISNNTVCTPQTNIFPYLNTFTVGSNALRGTIGFRLQANE